MDNFDLKKFVSGKTLLNESTPGYDTRKQGEALPTLESVKAAYEAKNGIKEDYENDYNSSSYDLVKDMTFEKVKDVIQYHKVDPSEVIADLISRFGLSAEFLSEGIIKEDYANSEEDYTDSMVVEKIKDIIKYHELDPQDVMEEIGQEFGIAFEFGRM